MQIRETHKDVAASLLERIKIAEGMAPAGSYEHGLYVSAILYMERGWIKALLNNLVDGEERT